MQLNIRLDPKRLRRWHVRLIERLARRRGTLVGVEWATGGEGLPSAVSLLFALERMIYGLAGADVAAEAAADEVAPYLVTGQDRADLVLDLSGAAGARDDVRTWS